MLNFLYQPSVIEKHIDSSSLVLLNHFFFKVPEVVVPVPVPETQDTETTDVTKDPQTKKNAAKEDGRDGSM